MVMVGSWATENDHQSRDEEVQVSPERRKTDPGQATNDSLPTANETVRNELSGTSLYDWIISQRNERLKKQRYILSALRMYGDSLGECINDPALTKEEKSTFEKDSEEVELLVKDTEKRLDEMKRYGR
jgi:hypothetical protein